MAGKIVKAIGGVLLAALLGWLALTAVYLLPQEPMLLHAKKNSAMLYALDDLGGVTYWVDHQTVSSVNDAYTEGLMVDTALFHGENVSWEDALLNPRLTKKKDHLFTHTAGADGTPASPYVAHVEFPLDALRDILDGKTDGMETAYYPRYWNGYLLWLKPLLYALPFGTIRLLNMTLQIALAFALFGLLRDRLGKLYGWAFLLIYLMMNPVTMALAFQTADMFYLGALFTMAMLYKEKWIAEGKEIYIFTAAGIATAYFDFLTYPLFSYGIPMTVALLLAHKKGLLQKSFDGAKRVVLGGIFWAIGYGGMYMSKWALATLMTDVNVFTDALTQLFYRMGNTQMEADKPAIVDVGNMLILNFVPLLKTPALLAFVLFAIGLILLRLRKLKRKVPLTSYGSVALGLLLLCASPFVWYLVFLNHSYLHFWFTFRELAIFAFAFAALLIVRTEEKGRDE